MPVHMGEQERLHLATARPHPRGKADKRPPRLTDFPRAPHARSLDSRPGFADHVLDEARDDSAREFVDRPRQLQIGVGALDFRDDGADEWNGPYFAELEQT